jgi:hypothetical protein
MANKQITHSYSGMMQDITKSKFGNQFYFEGKNIRIISTDTQSTGSITNEKGNKFILSIPTPVIDYNLKTISYNDKVLNYTTSEINYNSQSATQKIIGHSNSRNYIILFTTDNNGFDCIWKVSYKDYEISLLYLRNLEFSVYNPIQVINNFENEKLDKVYWVDSVHQLRYLNINHSIVNGDLEELIDVSENTINMTGKYNLSEPLITNILSGGNHTAGMIQYTYNLYKLNSAQTKISPLSKLVSLDKGVLGGGDINELVGKIPVIEINDIDINYTNIKVYSIKYNTYNGTPIISLIEDREIPQNRKIEIFDDNTIIKSLSLEEFLFLGSDIIIPKHIESKDNRLFFANYNEKNFEVKLDVRAYSFDDTQNCTVHTNIFYDDINNIVTSNVIDRRNITNVFTDIINDKFDSINLDYNNYKFQYDGITKGGEGKYIKYELTQSLDYDENFRYFKDEEIYRLGIQFYNNFGQVSLPLWVADFKSLNGNLEGNFNTLKVTLKPDFYVWLNNSSNFNTEYDKPIGYRTLIAERTLNDRTIISNGLLGTMMFNINSTLEEQYGSFIKENSKLKPKLPNILFRNCNFNSLYGITQPLRQCLHLGEMSNEDGPNTECWRAYYGDKDTTGRSYQFNSMLQLYSPETLFYFNQSMSNGLKLKIKGLLKNKYNGNWAKEINLADTFSSDEAKVKNGLSTHYAPFDLLAGGNAYNVTDRGIIGHPGGSDPNMVEKDLYYRGYGDVLNSDIISNNNVISFFNDLNTTIGSDPDDNISKPSLKTISVLLNSTYTNLNISYEITPDVVNLLDNYDVQIASDPSGNNILNSLNGVNGLQIISDTQSFTVTPTISERVYNYYLIINSNVNFSGTINVIININGSGIIEKTISNEQFQIIPSNNISGNYYIPIYNNNIVNIYGRPELTDLGQMYTTYNNDVNYRFTNSLESIITDGDSSWKHDGNCARKIVSVNGEGQRCITIVTDDGTNNQNVENWDRPTLESIFNTLNIQENDYGLIGEIIKNDYEIYLGGIYGGNSWEDKLRTNYIEIGNYKLINDSVNYIESPGDTFVNFFKFLRIHRKNGETNDQCIKEYEEIVEYYTESTINLKNRNDLSLNEWDDKFMYRNDDYHKYNKVYSQQSNLITRRNINYNIKKNNNFDTNIISSKLKSSGELVDSWTDILQNDVITLDGKFGAINSLIAFNDEIYSLQDKAFAFISINPRVQIQAADGLAVELGTGGVLQDYKYISTESGTLNKWSVVISPQGIYYFDIINRSFNKFEGNIKGLSDAKELHTFFINNVLFNILLNDNPLIKEGISSGYDFINNDVFMSFHQNNYTFTISYNEKNQAFISFYDYIPSMYISKGDHFITTHPDINKIYKQYEGNYNEFYDEKFSSHIILNVNPEADKDCVFDNINFKSDVTLDNLDQVDKTLTGIRAYNDYQDSNTPTTVTPLVVGRNNNLRRKFRDWSALIPRQSRNRIRAPYIKLKLQFDNTNNYKLILHNINIYYTV